MNFGIQDIQNIIYNQLVKGNANVTGGRGKFAKDTAKRIFELIEDQPMNRDMKTEARARGIPDWAINFSDRAADAFGFGVMNLGDSDISIYKWILEQEQRGQKIEDFAEWAKKEKAQYIRMYRKDTSNIKIDWQLAFPVAVGRQTEFI